MLRIFILLLTGFTACAQGFNPGFKTFSSSKPSYLTMKDGTETEGTMESLDRKKGLIEAIKLKDADNTKRKIKPEDVREMYLPASSWSKLGNALDAAIKVDKWENSEINSEIISKGYAFFENAKVILKEKEYELLMQIVNPSFAGKIRVYFDPWASETMSVGFGGLVVAGGIDKSYYVKAGELPAFKVEKKNYSNYFDLLYGSCPELVKKLRTDYKWEDFAKHVYEHASCN